MGNKTTGASILALLSAVGVALLTSDAFVSGVTGLVAAHPRLAFISVLISVASAILHVSPVKPAQLP